MIDDLSDKLSQRYQRAIAHSRLVYFLKIALPLTALLMVFSFIFVSYVRTQLPQDMYLASAAIKDGAIIMNAPVIAGQGANNLPYRLKAERAIQEIGDMSRILLQTIEGQISMSSGGIALITAQEGHFDEAQNLFTLTKPFDVDLSTGIKAHFADGIFNMQMNNFETDNGVEIEFEDGVLSAQSIEIKNGGEVMHFEGNVRMRIAARMANRTRL